MDLIIRRWSVNFVKLKFHIGQTPQTSCSPINSVKGEKTQGNLLLMKMPVLLLYCNCCCSNNVYSINNLFFVALCVCVIISVLINNAI